MLYLPYDSIRLYVLTRYPIFYLPLMLWNPLRLSKHVLTARLSSYDGAILGFTLNRGSGYHLTIIESLFEIDPSSNCLRFAIQFPTGLNKDNSIVFEEVQVSKNGSSAKTVEYTNEKRDDEKDGTSKSKQSMTSYAPLLTSGGLVKRR